MPRLLPGLREPGVKLRVVPVMTPLFPRRMAPIFAVSLMLGACGTLTGPSGSPSVPTPQPKPGPTVPAELSRSDAETTCLMQGSRKFGVPLADVRVTGSKVVDAGYLVSLDAGGAARTCIIAKDGFVRSLR